MGGTRSQLVFTGGHIEVSHLADIAAEISGEAKLTLWRGSAPLENCEIGLDPTWTGLVFFQNRMEGVVRDEDLRRFTVGGDPAEEGVNVVIGATNQGGCALQVKPGYTPVSGESEREMERGELPEIADGPRVWTDLKGRTITASLVDADEGEVVVMLEGKPTPIPIETLSNADRDYVAQWLRSRASMVAGNSSAIAEPEPSDSPDADEAGESTAPLKAEVPLITGPIADVSVEVGKTEAGSSTFTYVTPHFEFISERALTTRVVSGFSVLYEAT